MITYINPSSALYLTAYKLEQIPGITRIQSEFRRRPSLSKPCTKLRQASPFQRQTELILPSPTFERADFTNNALASTILTLTSKLRDLRLDETKGVSREAEKRGEGRPAVVVSRVAHTQINAPVNLLLVNRPKNILSVTRCDCRSCS